MEKLESIIFGLKAEVERLQGENAELKEENAILKGAQLMIVPRSNCKTIRRKLLMFDKMKEHNAELQKQVDELTAKLQCPTDITEAVKPFVSQAVKDTAKEILQEAENLLHECAMEYANAGHKDYFGVCENISWKVIRKIAKDKGVEVK